jgi:hypothetical protein
MQEPRIYRAGEFVGMVGMNESFAGRRGRLDRVTTRRSMPSLSGSSKRASIQEISVP